jgi:hypothetical protein
MINILGVQRVIGIAILLVLNLVVGAAVFMYVMPEKQKTQTELRRTQSMVAAKRNEIERIKDEFVRINQRKLMFEDLQKMGFFGDQDRIEIKRRFEAIDVLTDVLRAKYKISEAGTEENEHTEKMNHVILNTPFYIEVEAIDDLDVFRFIYWIENGFSGHTAITNVKLERVADLDDATLRYIGTDDPKTMVKGSFEFDWRTLIPKEDLGKLEGAVQ